MINLRMIIAGEKDMVLPSETEERVKRRALNACQDNLRKVVDVSQKNPSTRRILCKRRQRKRHANFSAKLKQAKKKSLKHRRMVSQELAEIGAILYRPRRLPQIHQLIKRNSRLLRRHRILPC